VNKQAAQIATSEGLRLVLAPIGFVIWTIALPHSIWGRWDSLTEGNGGYLALIVVVGGGVLAGAGENILSYGGDDWDKPW